MMIWSLVCGWHFWLGHCDWQLCGWPLWLIPVWSLPLLWAPLLWARLLWGPPATVASHWCSGWWLWIALATIWATHSGPCCTTNLIKLIKNDIFHSVQYNLVSQCKDEAMFSPHILPLLGNKAEQLGSNEVGSMAVAGKISLFDNHREIILGFRSTCTLSLWVLKPVVVGASQSQCLT